MRIYLVMVGANCIGAFRELELATMLADGRSGVSIVIWDI